VVSVPGRPRGSRRWLVPAVSVLLVPAFVTLLTAIHVGWPWSSGESDHDHVHRASDGTRQPYQVHLPPQYDGRTELPVVMAIHGCGMTGSGWNSMRGTTQFDTLADREGFIVVYPTQRPFESLINCWNSADPRNQQRGAGEPALLAGVVRDVVDTYGADPHRVHVAGASSGAGTAVILAATYPDLFATATSVAGGEYGLNQVDPDDPDATPPSATARQAWAQMGDRQRHVPLLVVQGGRDDVVPTIVGERLVEHWTHVHDLVDDGLPNGSLALTATTTSVPAAGDRHGYERTVHATAEGRTLVEYVLVPEMEHAWSGPDGDGLFSDRAGPDAAELVWRFAQRHDVGPPPR
jgi:poly(hydroxyalkanoate) depolymerase family esterase